MDIGFLEAWARWWDGQQLGGFSMWGTPILTWARLGKAMQFAAGLVVVLDLVGPERIRSFGGRLGAFGWREARARIKAAARKNAYYREVFALLKDTVALPRGRAGRYFPEVVVEDRVRQESAQGALEDLAIEDPSGQRLARAIDALAWMAVIGGLLFYLVWTFTAGFDALPGWSIAVFILLSLLAKYVVLLISLAVALPLAVVRSIYSLAILALTAPIAWLLGKQGDGHPVRVLAFATFVFGFHFDLLGS